MYVGSFELSLALKVRTREKRIESLFLQKSTYRKGKRTKEKGIQVIIFSFIQKNKAYLSCSILRVIFIYFFEKKFKNTHISNKYIKILILSNKRKVNY